MLVLSSAECCNNWPPASSRPGFTIKIFLTNIPGLADLRTNATREYSWQFCMYPTASNDRNPKLNRVSAQHFGGKRPLAIPPQAHGYGNKMVSRVVKKRAGLWKILSPASINASAGGSTLILPLVWRARPAEEKRSSKTLCWQTLLTVARLCFDPSVTWVTGSEALVLMFSEMTCAFSLPLIMLVLAAFRRAVLFRLRLSAALG